jgi:precorrin-6A/cobalt-precorrin-6A reductase
VTVLLLAGTAEARHLAQAMARRSIPVLASLAGAVRQPLSQDVPTRIGGFGGEAGFIAVLEDSGITAVVDATHPFAAQITARTARICASRKIPCLRLERPGWTPGPGDEWTMIDDEAGAAAHVPPGATVFLATGRQTLEYFDGLQSRTLYCRQIDQAERPFPFPKGAFVIGRPPFTVAGEEALFARLGIEWLVTKNSGGHENRTKLDAARNLGIRVLMIRRPDPSPGPKVETVEEAITWLEAL